MHTYLKQAEQHMLINVLINSKYHIFWPYFPQQFPIFFRCRISSEQFKGMFISVLIIDIPRIPCINKAATTYCQTFADTKRDFEEKGIALIPQYLTAV